METLPFVYAGLIGTGVATNVAIAFTSHWGAIKRWWWKLWGWKCRRLSTYNNLRHFKAMQKLFQSKKRLSYFKVGAIDVTVDRKDDDESEMIANENGLECFPRDTVTLSIDYNGKFEVTVTPVFGNGTVMGFDFWVYSSKLSIFYEVMEHLLKTVKMS